MNHPIPLGTARSILISAARCASMADVLSGATDEPVNHLPETIIRRAGLALDGMGRGPGQIQMKQLPRGCAAREGLGREGQPIEQTFSIGSGPGAPTAGLSSDSVTSLDDDNQDFSRSEPDWLTTAATSGGRSRCRFR
jgi:hypothetical protein